ncbi:MAG TPA: hypothetical protein VFG04_20415 [Planctomycetaceae bacterium]|jgi:hypothetical protein|nr:hypothetical protein [Planctomycetaceae bacterium]
MARGKTHSTHAGMGQLDAILAGAASGPPDRAKVMEITLKLRADSGNSAVLKQLSEQVKDAARKAIQEAEHLGEALVKKAHGWAKDMGEAITKSLEKAAEQREKAEQEAKLGSASASAEKAPAGKEIPAHPETEPAKTAATPKETSHAPEPTSEKKPEEKKDEKKESIFEKLGTALEKGKSAHDHFKEAKSADNDAVKRVVEGFAGATDAKESIKAGVEVFNRLKDVATAGKPIAEVGFKGMAANLGNAAVAGVGGWGTIAGAAQVAGIGAVAVAGGVALHDGFKLLLNKVGFLGGNFDTLSGTVMEWNESTKRSAEIEKKIAETQEAHQKQLEQIQRNEQNVRSVYEAKDRIEESQKFQHEAAEMVPMGARYAQRINAVDPNNVGSASELHERDQNFARDDRTFAQDTYAQKLLQKQKEQAEAADTAQRTREHNTKLRQNQGGVANPQKEGEGGIIATTVSLQEQLLQEEKSLKLANEMRTMTRERTIELGNQLAVMEQQVRAAEHQKAAAQEQAKAEKERELSDKARMSMLSKGDQQAATGIFKKLAHGQRIDRKDAIFLQEHGLTSGAIQHKVNDRMAEDLDPEFVKWRKAAGGEEALDNAQQHLAESTRELAQAQKDAKKTLHDYMKVLQDFAHTSDTAAAAHEKVETTKSDKEGYSNPYALRPGEKPHQTASAVEMVKAAIQTANADFAKALKEIADAVVNGAKRQAAEASRNAQRAKETQNS